jgi:uncharacterized protein (DUF1697 family)
MKTYIALLRAVNVGGTGKLPMAQVRAMCAAIGFVDVRTYIASGNVVLRSAYGAKQVKAALEKELALRAGKPVGVLVRTKEEMAVVLASNPFPHAAPNRNVVIFLDGPVPPDTLASIRHRDAEEIVLGKREIHVHYGDGMADSKLSIPAARSGTARNMNTVAQLVELAGG